MLQRRIGKGPFHHRLAIVELAIDRDGADVLGQRRHQLSLADTDLVEREQHDDLNTGQELRMKRQEDSGDCEKRRAQECRTVDNIALRDHQDRGNNRDGCENVEKDKF